MSRASYKTWIATPQSYLPNTWVRSCTFDYWNVTRKEQLLSRAVSRIGGRSGSIPVWPFGAEYRITLTAVPNTRQLEELRIANQMRGRVGIAFEDCNLSQQDIDRFRENLAACHLFVVRNGKLTPLRSTE